MSNDTRRAAAHDSSRVLPNGLLNNPALPVGAEARRGYSSEATVAVPPSTLTMEKERETSPVCEPAGTAPSTIAQEAGSPPSIRPRGSHLLLKHVGGNSAARQSLITNAPFQHSRPDGTRVSGSLRTPALHVAYIVPQSSGKQTTPDAGIPCGMHGLSTGGSTLKSSSRTQNVALTIAESAVAALEAAVYARALMQPSPL